MNGKKNKRYNRFYYMRKVCELSRGAMWMSSKSVRKDIRKHASYRTEILTRPLV